MSVWQMIAERNTNWRALVGLVHGSQMLPQRTARGRVGVSPEPRWLRQFGVQLLVVLAHHDPVKVDIRINSAVRLRDRYSRRTQRWERLDELLQIRAAGHNSAGGRTP